MVNPERIKNYRFGALTANASGYITPTASSFPINGEILKIVYDYNNFAANGSLFIQVGSPVVENIGSLIGGLTSDTIIYPRIVSQGNNPIPFVVDEPIQVSGAGVGNASGCTNLIVYYR